MYTPSIEAPSHVWTREETLKAIKNDFMNRYYVTGRLSLDHYHPRCFFDSGPGHARAFAGGLRFCTEGLV